MGIPCDNVIVVRVHPRRPRARSLTSGPFSLWRSCRSSRTARRRANYTAGAGCTESGGSCRPSTPHNSGISSFVPQPHLATVTRTLGVETVTLDAVLEEHKLSRCRFCKIDVERTELEVLRGFERTLRAHDVDYLLVELLAGAPAHQYLNARGYHAWLVSEKSPRLIPIADVAAGTFGDYVFVRSELLASFRESVLPLV